MDVVCKPPPTSKLPPMGFCEQYDPAIYEQLPEHQKEAIDNCGILSVRDQDIRTAFETVFINPNFLDPNWLVKPGSSLLPSDSKDPIATSLTQYSYEKTMLKPAETGSDGSLLICSDMIIPKGKHPQPFAWHEVPNNPASHSIFLYVEEGERSYPDIMLACQPPPGPPLTPEEVLKRHQQAIEFLLHYQTFLLKSIYTAIAFYREYKRFKTDTLKEYVDIQKSNEEELKALEEKRQKKETILDLYKTSCAYYKYYTDEITKMNAIIQKIKDRIKDLQDRKKGPPPSAASKTTIGMIGDVVKAIPKWIVKKFSETVTQEDIDEAIGYLAAAEKENERNKEKLGQAIHNLSCTGNLIPANIRAQYKAIEDNFLVNGHTFQSPTANPLLESEFDLIEEYDTKRVEMISEDTRMVFQMSEEIIFNDLTPMIKHASDSVREQIRSPYADPSLWVEQKVLNYLILLPNPDADSFAIYNDTWNYPAYSRKPSAITITPENDLNISFVLPTFESFIDKVSYQISRYDPTTLRQDLLTNP